MPHRLLYHPYDKYYAELVVPAKAKRDRQSERQMDGETDRQTTDRVIPKWRFAFQGPQKYDRRGIVHNSI